MLLYVAGPYSAPTEEGIQANIQTASDVAGELWRRGHAVICPHKNGAGFHLTVPELSFDDWLRGDCQMIAACDGIVFLPGWENSRGSQVEMEYVRSLGMNDDPEKGAVSIWYYPDLPELHTTEVRSPMQVKAFREMTGQMMRTHLSKNADYSPLNIMGPGWHGIVTRVWDKVTRLMNLTGFVVLWEDATIWENLIGRITGALHVIRVNGMKPGRSKKAKHESIEDTLLDMSVYGIIGKLYREGKWGK